MISYTLRPADTVESQLWQETPHLSTWEFVKLTAGHTFERSTTLGIMGLDRKITQAEIAEGTADLDYGVIEDFENTMAPHAYAMAEEDWKKSEYYDKRIQYTPDMTVTRARILKEDLARRDEEKATLARETTGIGRTALGFGAGMVATLPDPVNLISFGSGAVANTAGQAVFRGAVSGAVSNIAASAVVLPMAQMYGEDITWKDYALDGILGGVLGGGLGVAGYGLRQLAARKGAAGVDLAGAANGAKAGEPASIRDLLLETGLDGAEADSLAEAMTSALRGSAADAELRDARSILGGMERADAGRLVDRVTKALADNEPLDIARFAREVGADIPYKPAGLDVVNTARLVNEGRPLWARDMDFAEMLPLAEKYYKETVVPGPPARTAKGDVHFQAGNWRKYRNDISPDKIRLVPFLREIVEGARWGEAEAPRRQKHQRQGMKVYPLRAAVELDGRVLDVRLRVREDANGKLFYNLAEFGEFVDGKKPPDSGGHGGGIKTPPESSGLTAEARTTGGERAEGGAYLGTGDLLQRQTARLSGGSSVSSTVNISAAERRVNLSVTDITPDMRPELAAPESPTPRVPKSAPEELANMGIDARTGKSFDELDVERLAVEGKVTPDQVAELAALTRELDDIDITEEAALGILGCVMGAI